MATAAKKTRVRSSSKKAATKKSTQTAAEKKRAQSKTAEEQEARNKAREAAQAAKEKARQDAIKSGELIVDGDVEFYLVGDDKDTGKLEQRAADVLKALKGSKVPLRKQDIAGADITATGMFAMLKALGYVKVYRARSGERGGSGVAYLLDADV